MKRNILGPRIREIRRELGVTQADLARRVEFEGVPDAGPWLPEVKEAFEAHLAGCPADERPFLLAGYGNLIRNRNELGIEPTATTDGSETVII